MKTFRLAQLNLLNSPAGLEARYERLARHLELVRPTVLTLQEITDPELLLEKLAPLGFKYHCFTSFQHNAFDQIADAVGIVSRVPLTAPTELPFPVGPRPAMRAEVELEGLRVGLATAHLAWGSTAEGVRLRQAEFLDEQADKFFAEAPEGAFILAGDLNSDEDSRTVRFLRGVDLGSDNLTSTYWTDAYQVAGAPGEWATSDQGQGTLGPASALRHGVVLPELLPQRRIDYILSHGWRYGKLGCPIAYGRFGAPLAPEDLELSDHYGIWADILVEA